MCNQPAYERIIVRNIKDYQNRAGAIVDVNRDITLLNKGKREREREKKRIAF